ncbi:MULTISPECIES: family 4 glycosyl hydrolase [Lachnospiraceae]|jgi:alpha-galactosidase/6-phospho-beta-glucosidase family protein|uniref:Alpha-glucosidase/alpha-galactosidase n=1 Tax=Faecalicatena acetigenes TaxID=2981790 RepID=A0ABT2TA73_9FIRM|nr:MULTISPECIES: alpha-glucosidase/alpha-galactosidase [Lachnospiraceae]MCU6747136.1 alpha-glucosidase/alpha-galactosidase [Faecalicatena acetigenes]RGT74150.1 alpha-glucosidase/alpha-galactosidase [Ruminococcus sp. AF18-22]SCH67487.1 Putative glucosidase lplD [uncultured Clostridium sp.]
MIYKENKAEEVQIAYIGGGSRGWAWTFMTDLALEPDMSGTIRLYDIDREAAKANEVIGNAVSAREDAKGKWEYRTCDSLGEALTGADFVVISILPGTFDEMESDVHMPERLGIYQSVGDTAGPGGMIRALRTIPMFAEIAEAVKRYAPSAWVINYTNPMSLCVKTLYHTFPQIKAFGCCHEVFGTQKVLKGIVEEVYGIQDVKREDIHVNVLGINHFTWFDYASYKGIDLFPVYKAYVDAHFEEGYEERDMNWLNACFKCSHRVKFDLFRRYGLIAAAGDRHLAEFMPGDEYLKDPRTVEEWKFALTSVAWRKEDLKDRLEKSKRLLNGEEQVELQPTGEEGILLIKALCGLTRMVSNVNIPNHVLQIGNLPSEAVVETNAVFERDTVRPLFAGDLPEDIKALMLPHIENHERILKAALTYDKEAVVQAFLHDPLVQGKKCQEEDIRLLAEDMIRATLRYLPKEWAK